MCDSKTNIAQGGSDTRGSQDNCTHENPPVLGLSKTHSICIPGIPTTNSCNSVVGAADHNGDDDAESLKTQEAAGTCEDKSSDKLADELKLVNEKNKELREALRIVDRQCDKLVVSNFWLLYNIRK
ncbi:unnamed protein product [Gongylonema pulchrum]|uniref:Uncharacterized protein n=1 Tax=Gongylonema pulchrum TaxID=637853 RepID=A0A3P6T9Z2_9BILA|nr:unnamed protein product [Gongylonema pulchrum]